MVSIILKLLLLLFLVVVVILSIFDTVWFNEMPETHKRKSVLAFNVVVLWIVAILLIIKIMVM